MLYNIVEETPESIMREYATAIALRYCANKIHDRLTPSVDVLSASFVIFDMNGYESGDEYMRELAIGVTGIVCGDDYKTQMMSAASTEKQERKKHYSNFIDPESAPPFIPAQREYRFINYKKSYANISDNSSPSIATEQTYSEKRFVKETIRMTWEEDTARFVEYYTDTTPLYEGYTMSILSWLKGRAQSAKRNLIRINTTRSIKRKSSENKFMKILYSIIIALTSIGVIFKNIDKSIQLYEYKYRTYPVDPEGLADAIKNRAEAICDYVEKSVQIECIENAIKDVISQTEIEVLRDIMNRSVDIEEKRFRSRDYSRAIDKLIKGGIVNEEDLSYSLETYHVNPEFTDLVLAIIR